MKVSGALMLVGILVDGVAGLQLAVGCPRTVCASVRRLGAVAMSEAADSDLWASLRARMETTEAPPLGVDEVGADCMGPQDVVAYIMKSMSAGDLNAILGFSVKYDEGHEDKLGQLQPGTFADGPSLKSYLGGHERYRTLVTEGLEWKTMGGPDFSDMSRKAAQKLLVRRDGANWEDFFINLFLADTDQYGKRWLVTSIYKQGVAN